MARAPRAIQEAMVPMVDGVVGAVFSGIVGDVNHSYGYHLARNQLPGNDYSVQYGLDREGADDAASALDISLPAASMTLVVNRLMDASLAGDPRLFALREWFGARSGEAVTGWDFRDPSTHNDDRVTTADDSHRWHVHLSGYRTYADDGAAWAAIASVFTDSTAIGGALSEEDDMTPDQWATVQGIDSKLNQLLFYAQEGPPPCKLYGDQEGGGIYLAAAGFWWHVPNPGYVALLQRYRLAGAVINVDHANEVGFFEGVFKGQAGNADVIAKLDELAATWHPLDPEGSVASAGEIVKQLGEAITKGVPA